MAEFRIMTDLAPVRGMSIEANFDEMRTALQELMKPYANMVVTQDGVQAAEKDRAYIRGIAARIDDMRKTVKKDMTAPLEVFEKRCNEIKAIAVDAANHLDAQIKGYEQQEVEAKYGELEAFFDEKANEDVKNFITFHKIAERNPRWKNKGYRMTDAQNDIMRMIATVNGGVQALRGYPEEYRAVLLDKFRDTLDLGEVIQTYDRIQRQKQYEEMRRAEAARRALETTKAPERETAPAAPENPAPPAVASDAPENEPVAVIDFRVWVTKKQMAALGAFLKTNGIKYGKVPK